MKIGFLFPGQGSQTIGMGKELYDNYAIAKEIYDNVTNLTGIDIAKISFEGPEEVLNQTKYTQIAILTMSLAITAILKNKNIIPQMTAGLSLGEYSALICSEALSFEEGVKLVAKRGTYMQELAPNGEWLMAAILGMTDEQVKEICKKVTTGFVVPANFNCKGQVVISGEKQAIEEAEVLAKEEGARKVRILNTAGPFHTELLKEASEALKVDLDKTHFQDCKIPVVKNIDGLPYTKDENKKEILAKHIISPVQFTKTIETMIENGIDTFIEIGPGKALSGFVKKAEVNKEIHIFNINNIQTLEDVIKFVNKEEI